MSNKVKNMRSLLLILFSAISLSVSAQTITVKGNVKDTSGEPVIGASVVEKGNTTNGTITDLDGNFSIKVDGKKTLVISYIGMKTQEVAVQGRKTINVQMVDDSKALDEVVVIGYGTVNKRDLTGSVASVSAKDLAAIPVASASEALTGKLAGVSVTTTEGSPDADIKIRVRGGGSLSQDNSPLYIVDGFPVSSISDIAPSEIQSIDVLKDASSTAIYGARGANGVIMITTKRGTSGDVKVDYDGYVGWKGLSHDVEMLNGQELAELINEEMYNADPNRTDYLTALSDPAAIGEGYNMMDILKRTAFYQKHNLAVSGGSDKANFRINTTYSTDQPVFIREDYKNYGIQFISDFTKGKLKLGETVTINRNLHDWSDCKILGAQKWSSTLPIYDDSHPTGFAGAGNGTDCGNPVAESYMNWNKGEGTTINGNIWATYEIIPGLKYKFNMGVDMYRYMVQNYIADYSVL